MILRPPRPTLLPYTTLFRSGRILSALPTRDAILPILAVLFSAHGHGFSLPQLFAELPPRFSRAALLRNFPRSEEHTSELQSPCNIVCRLLLEKTLITRSCFL